MYKHLEGIKGIPKVYTLGIKANSYVLVTEYIGPNIQSMLEYCNNKFSQYTVFKLAEQMLNLIQSVHQAGFIHCDIKPENFVIDKNNVLHLIDFGFSKRFYNKKTGEHIHFKEKKRFIGTPKFASLNTYLGYEQSRRDDLESLGYVLIYLLKGKFFGQVRTESELREVKMECPLEYICKGTPTPVLKYLRYCRGLMFEANPEYKMLLDLFKDTTDSKTTFDWRNEQINFKSLEMNVMHESHYGRCPALMKYEQNGSVIGPSKLSEKFRMKSRKIEIEKLIADLPKRWGVVKTKNNSRYKSSTEFKSMHNEGGNELPKSESLISKLASLNKVTDSLGYLVNSSLHEDTLIEKRVKEMISTKSLISHPNEKNTNTSLNDDNIPPERVVTESVQIPVCSYINNSKHWEENRKHKLPMKVKYSEISKADSNLMLNNAKKDLNNRPSSEATKSISRSYL